MEKILLQVGTKSIKLNFEEPYIKKRGIFTGYFLPMKNESQCAAILTFTLMFKEYSSYIN